MLRPAPLVLVLVAVALTACSPGTAADTASSTPTTASTTAEAGSRLSVDELRKDPCTGLTADQTAEHGLSPGNSIEDVGQGAVCMWSVPEHESNVVIIALDTLGGGGLDSVLANRAEHAYHDEVEIGGRPAVFSSSFDYRPEGACSLWVGVADGLAMKVDATLPEGPDAADPCSVAERIGTAVVGNLGTA